MYFLQWSSLLTRFFSKSKFRGTEELNTLEYLSLKTVKLSKFCQVIRPLANDLTNLNPPPPPPPPPLLRLHTLTLLCTIISGMCWTSFLEELKSLSLQYMYLKQQNRYLWVIIECGYFTVIRSFIWLNYPSESNSYHKTSLSVSFGCWHLEFHFFRYVLQFIQ